MSEGRKPDTYWHERVANTDAALRELVKILYQHGTPELCRSLQWFVQEGNRVAKEIEAAYPEEISEMEGEK